MMYEIEKIDPYVNGDLSLLMKRNECRLRLECLMPIIKLVRMSNFATVSSYTTRDFQNLFGILREMNIIIKF